MGTKYTQTRDSQGRVRIELKTHQPSVLLSAAIIVPAIVWVRDIPRKEALIFGGIALVVALAYYFARCKSLQLLINPVSRTLAVGVGSGAHVVKMDDVTQARIDEREIWQDKRKVTAYRIELVLRSSEIVPLTADYGRFSLEDCNRLVQRINLALRSQ